MKTVKLHTFSNGSGIFEFDGTVTAQQLDEFRQAIRAAHFDTMFISGYTIEVIEHHNPLWVEGQRRVGQGDEG